MDFNVVVLCGRLVAPPEIRVFDSGASLVRYLVTVRSTEPTPRVDVIPVTIWEPPDDVIEAHPAPGQRLWAVGSLQRRFWTAADGRRSRIEFIAGQIQFVDEDDAVGFVSGEAAGAAH